jgi:suppressor of ftsI
MSHAHTTPDRIKDDSSFVRTVLIDATLIATLALVFALIYRFGIVPALGTVSFPWFLFAFVSGLLAIITPPVLARVFMELPRIGEQGVGRTLQSVGMRSGGTLITLCLFGIQAALLGAYLFDTLPYTREHISMGIFILGAVIATVLALMQLGLISLPYGAHPPRAQKNRASAGILGQSFKEGLLLGDSGVGVNPALPLLIGAAGASGNVIVGSLLVSLYVLGYTLPPLLLTVLAHRGINGLDWINHRRKALTALLRWGTVLASFTVIILYTYYLPSVMERTSIDTAHDATDGHSHGSPEPLPGAGTLFSTDTEGLPFAVPTQFVTLRDGDTYALSASYVQKQVGSTTLRMLAYNGSVPGPFIRIEEGGTARIVFTNNTDIDQTIHSHGIRVDNAYDGTPGVTQDAVKPGETFTYTITFPDIGLAWYHPHTRDDYGQELGLYGNYFVTPAIAGYFNPVNRELPLVLDDLLIEDGVIAPFYKEYTNHALLGRFGNMYFVNGEIQYELEGTVGEVVRFLTTNVSNTRTYRLSIPGAEIKRVGGDQGKFERETFEEELIIAPAERLIIEVYFPNAGTYVLTNRTDRGSENVAQFKITEGTLSTSYLDSFKTLRNNTLAKTEFDALRTHQNREPDKNLNLTVALTGMVDHSAHVHANTEASDLTAPTKMPTDMIQWSNQGTTDAVNTTGNTQWKVVDTATGKSGMDIPIEDWTFTVGDLVKIRITNDAQAAHVMQHPVHVHGQRFVVLAENGIPNTNMVWKDTALILPGGTLDILVEMSNPGEWMIHCHIAEHLHAGMMMPFRVEDTNRYAAGDEYRRKEGEMNLGNIPKPQPKPSLVREYTFNSVVTGTITAKTENATYQKGVPQSIDVSFYNAAGNTIALDPLRSKPLTVTFVSEDGTDYFVSYPGNTTIHERGATSIRTYLDGILESIALRVPRAIAHDGHDLSEEAVSTSPLLYRVPAYFLTNGRYKAFITFYLEGDETPFQSSVTFEVR